MVNFVIVDDNKLQRKRISNVVLKKMMANKIDFKVYEYDDYNKELENYISHDTYNTVYILDLELPSGDGVDLAREIRNKYSNWKSPIIIITVHTSLCFEVYKQRLQILDFIGKCEDIESYLEENLDICLKMLNKDRTYRYTYKNIDYTINLDCIDYIQREGRKVRIVTSNGEYYQNISVKEIKNDLPSYFVISSKGIVININNVERIDWALLKVFFKDKTSGFLVSRSHKKEIDNFEV